MYRLDANSSSRSCKDSQPYLNPREFKKKYRMTRESFKNLVKLIKNHPVFGPGNRRARQQESVENQLLTFLYFIGHLDRNGHSSRSMYSLGFGMHYLYCDRVATAICSLRKGVVFWPDQEERKDIASRMRSKFDFPYCVGVGDGTLFPLAYAPSTTDAPDYSGRKHRYSITCFIINDNRRRIRAYQAG